MFKKIFLSLFMLSFSLTVFAEVKLPSILADHMVLQRNSEAALWGMAVPESEVVIMTSWDGKTYKITADAEGQWKVKVQTPEAGGPYNISFQDSESKVDLMDILIGEVWVCSGQSNMAMPMVGKPNQPIVNSDSIIKKAENSKLHLFTVAQEFTSEPKTDVSGTWMLTNPENVANFSAVAYQFGEMLQKELDIPIGIIVSSWGGTPIRAWMNEDAIKKFPEYSEKDTLVNFRHPSVLYNAMISPLTPYSIAGFLWYQGENDRKDPAVYEKALPAMVKQWRNDWNKEDLPFYYVQIAPFHYRGDKGGQFAPVMREAQLNAVKKMEHTGMVVTSDVGSNKTIHPPDKTTVAQRLANLALAHTYNKENSPVAGPEFSSFQVIDDELVIEFKNNDGLTLKNKAEKNFEIAGEDQKFHTAQANVEGNKLILSSEKVKTPVAARYGFKNYFKGNLFNNAGLPASSFRTDRWKMN